ncbi:dihydrofolate reductase [Blattabacterium cuenoti]|uniref:dihydrofolate reductase n=1 Tax=Blattabacterium cuenoti TaxID=1653831 RepID=UPI00163C9904|nr:dihydrofolate reductase [Blattabacterium cuenoti]
MKFILISAVSTNGYIGKNNKLMWYLPNDLKHFKKITYGETVLMGRKTFESIGKILPGRRNIILTKKKKIIYLELNKKSKNTKILSSLKEVFSLKNYEKIFVIGGQKIYESMIDKAEKIELTLVHKKFYGDKKFPKIDPKNWEKKHEILFKKDKNHSYDYSFIRYERKKTRIK